MALCVPGDPLARVELDDELLLDVGIDLAPVGDAQNLAHAVHLLQPARHVGVVCGQILDVGHVSDGGGQACGLAATDSVA